MTIHDTKEQYWSATSTDKKMWHYLYQADSFELSIATSEDNVLISKFKKFSLSNNFHNSLDIIFGARSG